MEVIGKAVAQAIELGGTEPNGHSPAQVHHSGLDYLGRNTKGCTRERPPRFGFG